MASYYKGIGGFFMTKELINVNEQMPVVTADDVRKFFCEKATEKEIALFLNIAKLNNLNPFNREIYIVKYGTYPASILTGYEVYLKRAERSGKYAGFKAWTEGDIPNMKACIEVYRKDWDKPLTHEVEYSEYVGKTAQGVPTRFWKDKPKTMLKKVVISQAFRFAFPDELAGMPYTADEVNNVEQENINKTKPIEVPTIGQESHETNAKGSNLKDNEEIEEIPFGNDNDKKEDKFITEPQRKRLFAIAKKYEWTNDDLKEYMKTTHNIESSKAIPVSKYEGIINFLSSPDEK